MPEKIILEDGSEREVLTQEELDALTKKAEEAGSTEELSKLIETQKTELEELRTQPGAAGIKNLRQALKKSKDALRAAGKKLDEEGNVIEKSEAMSQEEISNTASQATLATLISAEKDKLIAHLDSDSKEVVNNMYAKLTAGEKIDMASVATHVNRAIGASGLSAPVSNNPLPSNFNGGGPRESAPDSGKATESTKEMGKKFNISDEEYESSGKEVKLA